MSSDQPVVDLLDPSTLSRALKSRAAALQLACATGTSATDAGAGTDARATRTALDTAEKCVALLRAELVDHNAGDGTDGDHPPSAKRRAVERGGGQVVAVSSAITTVPAPGVVGTVRADEMHTGTDTTAISSTKSIHTQQPDGKSSSSRRSLLRSRRRRCCIR